MGSGNGNEWITCGNCICIFVKGFAMWGAIGIIKICRSNMAHFMEKGRCEAFTIDGMSGEGIGGWGEGEEGVRIG